MGVFSAMDVCASGMTAQRLRTDIISQNIANVETTRDENGNPYTRKTVVFAEKDLTSFQDCLNWTLGRAGDGVKVTQIVQDKTTPMRMVYDPSHPDADEEGYVTKPNVNVITEMTNLIDASRAFEANVTVFNGIKAMAMKAMDIGK